MNEFFYNFLDYINSHLKIVGSVLGTLFLFEARIRYKETMIKRKKFEIHRIAFANPIKEIIADLRQGTHLNTALLTQYPIHKNAMLDFVDSLRSFDKRRFLKKWEKYEDEYNKVKNLSIYERYAAIAPSEEALLNNPKPEEVQGWEENRKENIINILHDILKISKRNIWF